MTYDYAFTNRCRKVLAVISIVLGGFAVGLPEPFKTPCIALATGLNGASLYLLKEEKQVR